VHPSGQDRAQSSFRNGLFGNPVRYIRYTQSLHGRFHHQVLIIKHHGSGCIDRQLLPSLLKLPSVQLAAGHAVANATMMLQVLWGFRLTGAIEIGR
jgi:hypothetical protein